MAIESTTFSTNAQRAEDWKQAYISAIEQINQGVLAPVVDLSKLSSFDAEELHNWLIALGNSINVHVKAAVDMASGTATIYSVTPIQSDDSTSSQTTTKGRPKEKVSRPPNSFIIYRKEWHPIMVKANPGLHNNDISKLISHQWNNESQAIRDEYKRKSEEVKRQHAIDHPGYQYQPRKPSEKKKRMTRNKITKLSHRAAGAPSSITAKTVQASFEAPQNPFDQFAIDPTLAQYPNVFSGFGTIVEDVLTFDAVDDFHDNLYAELADWNSNASTQAAAYLPESNIGAAQYSTVGPVSRSLHKLAPIDTSNLTLDSNVHGITTPIDFDELARSMGITDDFAEVWRQETIADSVAHQYFDFNSYADNVTY